MGISRGAIKLTGLTLRGRECSGSAITFGVQAIQAGYDEATRLLAQVGKSVRPISPEEITLDGLTQYGRTIHQDIFFRMLGFDTVESIDVFPDEKPTHLLDLNRRAPSSMFEKYDLVYDGGTSEHCFVSSEALCNAMRLVKTGGRVIHHLPLNNWVDHGFFQFCPTVFFDLYEANGFEEPTLALHYKAGTSESYLYYDPWKDPRLPDALGGKAKVMAFFSARKVTPTSEIAFPIQRRYSRDSGGEALRAKLGPVRSPWARLERSLQRRRFRLRRQRL